MRISAATGSSSQLRAKQRKLGYTQPEVTEVLGLGPKTVDDWESQSKGGTAEALPPGAPLDCQTTVPCPEHGRSWRGARPVKR